MSKKALITGITATGAPRQTFLFHVGTPKTGTTSIQYALIRLSDDLKARGIHVPYDHTVYTPGFRIKDVPRGAPQTDGFAHFFDVRKRRPDLNLDWPQEVRTFLAEADAHTFVISHESMSQQSYRLRDDLLAPLAALADIRFLVYLRTPLSYLSSYCMQSIQGIGQVGPRRQDMQPVSHYLKGGYAGLLAPFENYGQVDARNFDRLRQEGRLLPDFFAALGVDDMDEQIEALENRNSSEPRLNLFCVLMALKRNGIPGRKEWFDMRRRLRFAGRNLEGPMTTSFLSASVGEQVVARWDEDREVLLERYGVSFDPITGFKPGPEVLSFSAEYAAALQNAAAPDLSDDQKDWLADALTLADQDLEEVLPSQPKKPRHPKRRQKEILS
jgi:hypothetical protein